MANTVAFVLAETIVGMSMCRQRGVRRCASRAHVCVYHCTLVCSHAARPDMVKKYVLAVARIYAQASSSTKSNWISSACPRHDENVFVLAICCAHRIAVTKRLRFAGSA
jgi:hypothetical protein